jgi:hypothetical protein
MALTLRFVQPAIQPEELLGHSIFAPTILQIAPCLGETGKRLLDAGELYQLFLALLDGQIIIPATPFNSPLVITGSTSVDIPLGVNYVPVRQTTATAITITLPTPVAQGYQILIKDSLGVCFANNFTINTRDGTLIDLVPTFVFANAFQAQQFVFDGIGWGVTA